MLHSTDRIADIKLRVLVQRRLNFDKTKRFQNV